MSNTESNTKNNSAKIDILGVQTDAQRFDPAIACLLGWAQDTTRKRYVCTCPAYTLMMAREDSTVRDALNGADMVAADGMPVVWVQRRWGYPDAERVYGPGVMLALCQQSAKHSIRHYFWGGLPGVAEQLAARLTAQFPDLTIVGAYAPPIATIGDQPDRQVIERLNAARPDVIWVGLGSPKQDLWMRLYRPVLDAPLLIAVGAAYDFLAGVKPQAPRWMQQHGLEWAFRVLQEPRRLGKRYLIYNPRFIWAIWRQNGLRKRSI